MTSNNKLDTLELRRIHADGQREMIRLDNRLQAIIDKLLSIGNEIEDPRAFQILLHLGRQGDVKADLQKRY